MWKYYNPSPCGRNVGDIVTGKDAEDVFAILDELLTTVQVMVPRLYDAVIMKLKDI